MPRTIAVWVLALAVAAVALRGSDTSLSASSEPNSSPSAWKADSPTARPARPRRSNPLIVPPNPLGDKQSSDEVEALRSGRFSGLDIKDGEEESSQSSLLESWAESHPGELPEQREEGGAGRGARGGRREQQLSAAGAGAARGRGREPGGGEAGQYIAGLPRDDWLWEEEEDEGGMEEEDGGEEEEEWVGQEEEEEEGEEEEDEGEEGEEEGSNDFEDIMEHLSHYQRSHVLLERWDIEGAQRELREAISIDGNDADALALLGAIAAFKNKPDRAAHLFQQALAVDPTCISALCHEGHLFECHHNNVHEAEARYRSACSLSPSSFAPHAALASLLHYRLSDPEAAIQSYRQAIAILPTDVTMRVDAAKLFLAQGKATSAYDLLAPALRLHPSHAPLLRTAAHARWQGSQDKEGSLQLLERALALDPQDPAAMCDMALLLALANGQYEASEGLYQRAMAAAPDDPVPPREYGMMLKRQGGRVEEAVGLLQKALALCPSDSSSLARYADLLQEGQKYEEADECYARALDETPNNADILSRYALMLAGRMMREEDSPARTMVLQRRSGELLERAVAVRPSGGVLQYNLAAHYDRVQHDYDKARDHYQLAVRCDNPLPDAYFRLGYVLQYHLRDYGEAEAAYQGCLLAQPLHLEAMANYGLLLCNPLKRYHSSRRVLGRVLELAPDHEDARLGLKFLQLLDNAQRRQATEEPTSE